MTDWLTETYTGKHIQLDPTQNWYDIKDIAHALSLICRFNGHCKFHYSVAQHSVYVAHRCPRPHAMQGLLHDAAEAYIGDLVKPVKGIIPTFKEIENGLLREILKQLDPGTTPLLHETVKEADITMLATEAYCLMPSCGCGWAWEDTVEIAPVMQDVPQWTPEKAEKEFLYHYELYKSNERE